MKFLLNKFCPTVALLGAVLLARPTTANYLKGSNIDKAASNGFETVDNKAISEGYRQLAKDGMVPVCYCVARSGQIFPISSSCFLTICRRYVKMAHSHPIRSSTIPSVRATVSTGRPAQTLAETPSTERLRCRMNNRLLRPTGGLLRAVTGVGTFRIE